MSGKRAYHRLTTDGLIAFEAFAAIKRHVELSGLFNRVSLTVKEIIRKQIWKADGGVLYVFNSLPITGSTLEPPCFANMRVCIIARIHGIE